jgi:hypothetical protein
MSGPFFSIVITTYDRARIVRRCVDSCLAQSFPDFEVVVVDDGSTDDTVQSLERIDNPRLRVVAHESNRGMNASRRTGVANSNGEWIVIFDSDDELFRHTLARLHEIIERLPEEVWVVRSRLLWDDGHVTPSFVPAEPYGYEGRIRWAEAEGGSDAGKCFHHSVFEATPYSNRRGAMATLDDLNLSKNTISVCVEDVLGKVHVDAPNSWTRGVEPAELIPRVLLEAPDMLWMAETALHQHGAALAQHGPRQYRVLLRVAAVQAFLLGKRNEGASYALAALRLKKLDPIAWATLVLGLLGPRMAARGTIASRRLQRLKR